MTMTYQIHSVLGITLLCFVSVGVESFFFDDGDCSHNCTLAGNWYCGPIPCPYFPCDVPLEWTKGDCCEHCPTDKQEDQEDDIEPTVETKNVTAHYCPFPCTVGNQTLCYPPPCPPPACVDPARYKPTDCCVYCPHGNNCRGPHDSIIPWDHWKIIDGRNCTCVNCRGPDDTIIPWNHWEIVDGRNCTCNQPGSDAVCVKILW